MAKIYCAKTSLAAGCNKQGSCLNYLFIEMKFFQNVC